MYSFRHPLGFCKCSPCIQEGADVWLRECLMPGEWVGEKEQQFVLGGNNCEGFLATTLLVQSIPLGVGGREKLGQVLLKKN